MHALYNLNTTIKQDVKAKAPDKIIANNRLAGVASHFFHQA
jgi:hypothetical protein